MDIDIIDLLTKQGVSITYLHALMLLLVFTQFSRY
jgi:hypothetical protein